MLTLPAFSGQMPAGGDYNYVAAEIVALREHLQWGTQVVWSFGPLGYFNEPFYMDFNSWLIAFSANLAGHVLLFAVIALYLTRINARPWIYVFVAAVVLLTFDRYAGHDFERFAVLDQKVAIASVLLLYLALETSRRREAVGLATIAGLAIAYLFLDKGTFLIAGAGIAAVFIVLCAAQRRPAALVALAASITLGFVTLWLLAGQAIANIPAYFRTMYEIVAGYTPAMSVTDSPAALNAMDQVLLTAGLLALAASAAAIAARFRDWPLVRLALLSAPLIWLQYKNSFARFDENRALEFWALLGVVLGLALAYQIAATDIRRPQVWPAAAALIVCLSLVAGLGPYIGGFSNASPMASTFPFPHNVASYRRAAPLFVDPDLRAREDAQVLATMRLEPLPQAVVDELRGGTVDVVPFDLQEAFGYGLAWDPQPIWLSYSAWTSYLDHLNAQHFSGASAPRFVLFSAFTIDGRYPLFDEPEAYRVLFQRYQVVALAGDYVVLELMPGTSPQAETAAGNAYGQLGKWITVPSHGALRLYGRVHVDYSALGEAMNLLNGPPRLTIRLKYGDGQVSPEYRYVAAVGFDGLDLTGYAPDTNSVTQVLSGQFSQPIQAVEINANEPTAAYHNDITVQFFTVPVL